MGDLEAVKMPSTYQVGNGAGLFYLLGITAMISWKTENKKLLKTIAIVFGIIGILLSGSRACLIPFIIFIPFVLNKMYKNRTRNGKILMIITTIVIGTATIFYIKNSNGKFVEYFYERNIEETFTDTTGNGRTILIEKSIDYIKQQDWAGKIRSIILGTPWESGMTSEGILYIFLKSGIIAMLTFVLLLIMPIKHIYKNYKVIAVGLIGVFIAFCVDSSFNYPPALMNYFLIVGIFIRKQNENKSEIQGVEK